MNSLRDMIGFSSSIESKLLESGGELTPEIEKDLEFLDLLNKTDLPSKVDAVEFTLKRLENLETEWKERAKAIQAVSQGIAKSRDRLKEYVKNALLDHAMDEIKGNAYRIKLNRVKPKLIIDETILDPKYTFKTIVVEIDKEMLRRDLEAGVTVAGATLEASYGLRTYANKGEVK